MISFGKMPFRYSLIIASHNDFLVNRMLKRSKLYKQPRILQKGLQLTFLPKEIITLCRCGKNRLQKDLIPSLSQDHQLFHRVYRNGLPLAYNANILLHKITNYYTTQVYSMQDHKLVKRFSLLDSPGPRKLDA